MLGDSVWGGGFRNRILIGATFSTIAGGWFNTIQKNAGAASIGGGGEASGRAAATAPPGSAVNDVGRRLVYVGTHEREAI